MAFVGELQRRKVFKVAAAYLVGGWVVVQVASTLAPQLALPEWAPRLVTFLVLLGFPIALLLSWVFDMTPDGIRVTQGSIGNRRFYSIVAVIAAASLLWFFADRAGVDGPISSAEAAPSIAVLPFVNMSADPDNEYFADGMAEELLNILTSIDGLKVASRTSAFAFKGKNVSLPEIARQLGVRHVLEGSVRRQGHRVRITAQLIEAETDAHLWSETYDRDLNDIFHVQEEIARAITLALRDVLGTRQVNVEATTTDIEAYERLLRGRHGFYQRQRLDRAISDLQFVVGREPQLGEAWAYLAAAAYVVSSGGYPSDLDHEDAAALAMDAADRALAINPDLPLALAVKGKMHDNWLVGFPLTERAAALETQDSTARLWFGLDLISLGYIDRAVPMIEAAQKQDPLVAISNGYLGYVYFINGNEQEGARLIRLAAEAGDWGTTAGFLSAEFANRGDLDRAAEFHALMLRESGLDEAERADAARDFRAALADPSLRDAYFESLAGRGALMADHAMYAAFAFRDADRVFELIAASEPGVSLTVSLAAWLPSLRWLREEPRFFTFNVEEGVVEYWDANGYPFNCRRDADRLACP